MQHLEALREKLKAEIKEHAENITVIVKRLESLKSIHGIIEIESIRLRMDNKKSSIKLIDAIIADLGNNKESEHE